MIQARIASLHVYPVKSLKGVSLSSASALHSGLEGDRQWGIFKEDGHPLTQRKHPKMALISTAIRNGDLYLSAPGMGEIHIPSPSSEAAEQELKVWKDDCIGQYATEEANAWLSEALAYKNPIKLAKVHTGRHRTFIKPERFGVSANYFSDAAPYLVTNQASLAALNDTLESQSLNNVDMRHFRPNIVLESEQLGAFEEHRVKALGPSNQEASPETVAAPFHFSAIDHCQRCVMITINPDTGEYLPKAAPFKTLTQLNPMPDSAKAPAFGVNCTFHSSDQAASVKLHVGQVLELS